MTKFHQLRLSLAVVSALSVGFVGCGGTDSSTPSTNNDSSTINGTVADGYLHNAIVCVDKNLNYKCDVNETSTRSINGNYTLNVLNEDIGKYPIVVEVIAGETTDLDDGNLVTKSYILSTPKDRTEFISPVTTLIQEKIQLNATLTTAQAAQLLSEDLNLTNNHDKLFVDYILKENNDTESRHLHEVGKIIATLKADIRAQMITDLGEPDENKTQSFNSIVNGIIIKNIGNFSKEIQDGKTIDEFSSELDTIKTENKIDTIEKFNEVALEIENGTFTYKTILDFLKNKTVQIIDLSQSIQPGETPKFNGDLSFDANSISEEVAFEEKIINGKKRGVFTDKSDQGLNPIEYVVLDFSKDGLIISDGSVSNGVDEYVGSQIWLIGDVKQFEITDVTQLLPVTVNNATFNKDGTISNYWNGDQNFTIKDNEIIIPSSSGETWSSEYHLGLVYKIGGHDVWMWTTVSYQSSINTDYLPNYPKSYTSWYNYFEDSNGRITTQDYVNMYSITDMEYKLSMNGDLEDVPMYISDNNTTLDVYSTTSMGSRWDQYILEGDNIRGTHKDRSFFISKSY